MTEFQDIVIDDIDVSSSENITEDSGRVCFVLSHIPTMEWKSVFARCFRGELEHRQQFKVNRLWLPVRFDGLAQLKANLDSVLAHTNERYRNQLKEDDRKEAECQRTTEAGRDKLSAIRQELFDKGGATD